VIISKIKSIYRYVVRVTGYSARVVRNTNNAIIIMYHGIDDLFTAKQFEAHVKYFLKNFKIVSLDEIVRFAQGGYSANKLLVSLTFDDGLKNNFTNAYPILKKYNVPATFYVCPLLIDENNWLWNHETRQRLSLISDTDKLMLCRDFELPVNDIEAIICRLKHHSTVDLRNRFLKTIREFTSNYIPNDDENSRYDIMTWDDLLCIDNNLVEIGSHTVDHSILNNMNTDELNYQIMQSKLILENKLKRKIKHFCYPNGTYSDIVMEIVRQCYSTAVTTNPGKINIGDDLMTLNRIHSASDISYMARIISKIG